jgi:hypothetical protein
MHTHTHTHMHTSLYLLQGWMFWDIFWRIFTYLIGSLLLENYIFIKHKKQVTHSWLKLCHFEGLWNTSSNCFPDSIRFFVVVFILIKQRNVIFIIQRKKILQWPICNSKLFPWRGEVILCQSPKSKQKTTVYNKTPRTAGLIGSLSNYPDSLPVNSVKNFWQKTNTSEIRLNALTLVLEAWMAGTGGAGMGGAGSHITAAQLHVVITAVIFWALYSIVLCAECCILIGRKVNEFLNT